MFGWFLLVSTCQASSHAFVPLRRIEPIMGAGYHTIHHTAYRYNYGHYTTIMDAWYGTLLTPEEYPEWLKGRSKKSTGVSTPKIVAVNASA